MKLYEQILCEETSAMKSGDTLKRDSLRYLRANIQRVAKDSQKDIDDDMCISVAKKLIKQNIDAIKLVSDTSKLYAENEYWNSFIPKMMDEQETILAVNAAILSIDASSIKDMGKVVGTLKKEYGQKMDMKIASDMVKKNLK